MHLSRLSGFEFLIRNTIVIKRNNQCVCLLQAVIICKDKSVIYASELSVELMCSFR